MLFRSPPDNAAFLTRMFYGSLRYYLSLRKGIKSLGRTKKLSKEIESLVIMTLYQIGYMDAIPNYAALNEGIELIPKKFGRLKGYVTWLCHEFIRNPKLFETGCEGFFPSWFSNLLNETLGSKVTEDFERLSLVTPPVYFETHGAHPIEAPTDLVFKEDNIYKARQLSREERLTLEANGAVICDLLSLLIPRFFSPADKGVYLDLCSSPGGKLLTGLACFPGLNFHAVELNKARMKSLKQRLERSPLSHGQVQFHEMDGLTFLTEAKRSGMRFSRILLDAPCSGLGTIVSHPEYLISKKEDVIEGLPDVQKELLLKALEVLEPGGELIYSVCTFTLAETEAHFDQNWESMEFESVGMDLDGAVGVLKGRYGSYFFPGHEGNQIFYVMKISKAGTQD